MLEKLGEEYMRLRYLPDKEIADMLNYSQPSPFYRAFKNWFGVTPKAFRKGIANAQGEDTLRTHGQGNNTPGRQPNRVRS